MFYAHEKSIGTKKPHLSGAVRPLLEAFLRRRTQEAIISFGNGQEKMLGSDDVEGETVNIQLTVSQACLFFIVRFRNVVF